MSHYTGQTDVPQEFDIVLHAQDEYDRWERRRITKNGGDKME